MVKRALCVGLWEGITGQISLKRHVRLHTAHRNLSTVIVVRVSL